MRAVRFLQHLLSFGFILEIVVENIELEDPRRNYLENESLFVRLERDEWLSLQNPARPFGKMAVTASVRCLMASNSTKAVWNL